MIEMFHHFPAVVFLGKCASCSPIAKEVTVQLAVVSSKVFLQDMAVETLLKICNKCKRKFVQLHPMEQMPFVAELLMGLPEIIKDLKVHQINMFYESVALMIRAEGVASTRNQYLVRLIPLTGLDVVPGELQIADHAVSIQRFFVLITLLNAMTAIVQHKSDLLSLGGTVELDAVFQGAVRGR
jgi:hypothetical protein